VVALRRKAKPEETGPGGRGETSDGGGRFEACIGPAGRSKEIPDLARLREEEFTIKTARRERTNNTRRMKYEGRREPTTIHPLWRELERLPEIDGTMQAK